MSKATKTALSRKQQSNSLAEFRITLRMNNDDGEYLALVDFDDHTFCMQACERLKNYIGKPLKDAGDMEFEK